MNVPSSQLETLDARLRQLSSAASLLGWPLPRVRTEVERFAVVRAIESLLALVARGHGALDVAIGERLASLATGDRTLILGYAGIGDYAREELGINASTAQKMARLARELRSRPLLRAAVRAGEVSVRQARAVLPLARGEAEAHWVERAREGTVRALQDAVKNATGGGAEEDEEYVCVRIRLPPELRPVVEEAEQLSGKIVGATSPRWVRAEALCDEFEGFHGPPQDGGAADALLSAPAAEFLDPAKEWLEKQTAQWAFLAQPDPVAAPGPPSDDADVRRLHQELRTLVERRQRSDEVLGHLAMLFLKVDGWRLLGFASFEHYCSERLGMSERAVEQRAALERRLYELPALRQAMSQRRVSYEKARLIARHADEESIDEWIGRAQRLTCVALRRELLGQREAQMCARGEYEIWAPRRVAERLLSTFRTARKAAGRGLSPGECYGRIAAHFVETWKPALTQANTVQRRVLERDRWMCQKPGCSRPAAHVHHIEFRSAGGSDDPSNLVSICAAHHLRGIHMGRLRVRGKAPDDLHWEVVSPVGAPPATQ
ncbi:MAG: HNH endonuclease [Myxococcales bacterium]